MRIDGQQFWVTSGSPLLGNIIQIVIVDRTSASRIRWDAHTSTLLVRDAADDEARPWSGMTEDVAQVLVVDRDRRFRRFLESVLDGKGHSCEWIETTNTAAIALARGQHDVLIADVVLAGRDLELLRQAGALPNPPAMLILASRPSVKSAVSAFRLGAVDYLSKPIKAPAFAVSFDKALARRRAMLAVHRTQHVISLCADWFQYLDDLVAAPGHATLPDAVRARIVGTGAPARSALAPTVHTRLLSQRERQVLQAVALGLRPRDIAEVLKVSIHTARAHVKAIMRKLGAHSRAEIATRTRDIREERRL